MDDQDEPLADLIADVYRAAFEPDVWQSVATRVGALFCDAKTSIWLEDRTRAAGTVLGQSNYDEAYVASYLAHYAARNPWLQNKKGATGTDIHTTDQLCDRGALLRSEFYADWLRPQAIDGGLGANIFNDARRFMFLSLLRDETKHPTDERDLRVLEELAPHLQRAVQLHGQFASLLALQDALLGALDELPNGLVVLGPDGRLVVMNRRAESLLSRQDGLLLRPDGTLAAARAKQSGQLRRLLAGALALHDGKGQGNDAGSGGVMTVTRQHGRPLQIMVSPLPWRSEVFGIGFVGVFLHDPELDIPLPREELRVLYGLTPAEVDLATAVAEGTTLADYGESRGVTLGTARDRLKQVMAKMDLHRQADLVRVVLTLPRASRNGANEG